MPKVSDKVKVRNHTVKNRIAFLPCVTFSFDHEADAYFTEQHLRHYASVARGGAGIVYVQGTSALGVLGSSTQWTPRSKVVLARIASTIKAEGALSMIQISWGGDTETNPNQLSLDDLLAKQKELLVAAIEIRRLGFDGVEVHFGHGFTLSKMLDAAANRRHDRFGGSVENRASILTDILPSIREATDNDYIVGVRMGPYLPTIEDGLETARLFETKGIDLLNITFGIEPSLPDSDVPESYPLSGMSYGGWLVKQAVDIPVIGVGRINNAKKAQLLIANGYADVAGVARGILADPTFPRRILNGEPYERCRECRRCLWYSDHAKCPARLLLTESYR